MTHGTQKNGYDESQFIVAKTNSLKSTNVKGTQEGQSPQDQRRASGGSPAPVRTCHLPSTDDVRRHTGSAASWGNSPEASRPRFVLGAVGPEHPRGPPHSVSGPPAVSWYCVARGPSTPRGQHTYLLLLKAPGKQTRSRVWGRTFRVQRFSLRSWSRASPLFGMCRMRTASSAKSVLHCTST